MSGSFKARGAFSNLLMREVPAAASGGNHGVAVAYAALRLGRKARIFVPKIACAKIARIRDYGAELAIGGRVYAALAAARPTSPPPGRSPHAFDQVETMPGQGSVGLELEAQVPDLDTLLVAVGGGGLIGGIAAFWEGLAK
jgi:threonine dehydratase